MPRGDTDSVPKGPPSKAEDVLPLNLSAPAPQPPMHPGVTNLEVFRSTYVVTALNPKGWLFFIAFTPQFVDAQRPYWPQVTLYGALFLAIATVNAFVYASTAGRLAEVFTRPRALRRLKRGSAAFLVAAALVTAADGVGTLVGS